MDAKDRKNTNGQTGKENRRGISRRGFLKTASAALAGVIGSASLSGCEVVPEQAAAETGMTIDRVPIPEMYPAVPYTPASPPQPGAWRFFTPHEARTVEAFTARLLPGSPEDPGAREAGVVYYIDYLMSHPDGIAEANYSHPPYAAAYSGESPPEGGPDGERVIWIPEDQIERYGYQSIFTPREVLRMGLSALDRVSNQEHGSNFVELNEEQQDALIQAMVDEEVEGFEPLGPKSFFHSLRRYTMEGMFCDPVYGGNRDMAGWRLVGFPGAQRAYTPEELQEEGSGLRRALWNLEVLPPFNPGEPSGPNVINPVTGTNEHQHP